MPAAKPSILIVDDEPLIREGLRYAFESEDFEVQEAEGAHDALSRMQGHAFDLVLSDVRMPAGNGRELLQKMSELERRPPIVMMTGFADLHRSEALSLGAIDLVRKPFDLERLVKLVRGHLGLVSP